MNRRAYIAVCAATMIAYLGLAAAFCSPSGLLFALVIDLVVFCIAVFAMTQNW